MGTCIGAGFVSGAELVRFFGADAFFLPVFLSSLVFCFLLVLSLTLGKRYGGYEGVTRALFGRFSLCVRIIILFVSLVPCAGFLAGFDALLPQYKPLLSVIGLVVVSLFVGKGMKGVGILNAVLVPALLLFIFCYGNLNQAFALFVPDKINGFFGGTLYAGMNTFLALPVLMDAGKDMKCPKLSAALAALFIGLCALFVLGAVSKCGEGAVRSDMPFLFVMRGNILFYVAAALAIATSLASVLYPLFSVCERAGGRVKKYAARLTVMLAAFLLSRVGFSSIIGYFYPILGILGLCFSVFCIFHEYFFKQHDEKVHTRRQHAQKKGRAHNEVELKHLPAVDDQITEPRL